MTTFRALVVSQNPEGTFTRRIEQRSVEDLPAHAAVGAQGAAGAYDVLVRVRYSSLNYKDALSASGNKGVTRTYPHTPGIDAVGEIVETGDSAASAGFRVGDEVIVTSYDLGMNTPGGFGEYIRVPAAWLVPKPAGLSAHESMILGTAGFTAALCLAQLQKHDVTPDKGEVLVTGASGGVGSLSVAILSKLGYRVVAASGKQDARDWLTRIGAAAVISRAEADDKSDRPMLRERWAGVIDAVGGNILATALRSTKRAGCVTACGLTQSAELRTTVFPFILRGVALVGADSAETPMPVRREMWHRMSAAWKPAPDVLTALEEVVGLDGLDTKIDLILHGGVRGRVVVAL